MDLMENHCYINLFRQYNFMSEITNKTGVGIYSCKTNNKYYVYLALCSEGGGVDPPNFNGSNVLQNRFFLYKSNIPHYKTEFFSGIYNGISHRGV